MHHLPVQRSGPLASADRELLELCAEGWSPAVIAGLLGVDAAAADARLRELCERLGLARRPDGRPPMHAARLLLVAEARGRPAVRAA